MAPDVGIVILNWNGWRDTLNCVRELRSLTLPASDLDIVVVDNGSSDDSLAQLKEQDGYRLIPLPDNRGFAAGSNAGIRSSLAAGSRLILLLNNDVEVPPDFLRPLVQHFEVHPAAGLVSPKIMYCEKPDRLWYAGGRFREPRLIGWMEGEGELDTGQHNNARQVDYAVGCCMLIHRRVFERIGLLDERFFFFQEDVDFSFRARQTGFEVWYQPNSVIRHKVSQSTREDLPLRAYLDAQSRMVFFRSHIRGRRIPAVVIWEMARLTRITFLAARARHLKLARQYVRGLAAGWRAASQPPIRS